ncbi:MAG: electron transport complex subunit RsxC [Thermodesulfobacteriota bacterium]
MKLKTFEKGIHPAYHKELVCGKAIERAAVPKTVYIPLRQHVGAPCEPLVKRGDLVEEGQMIGDAKSFVSAPVHATVAGKVKNIDMLPFPGGGKVQTIVINTAEDFVPKNWSEGAPADIDSTSIADIRKLVRAAGIVGMGGAAFPSSAKISPPKDKPVNAVIINGCECEPYLSADHRLMVEHAREMILGLKCILKSVGTENAYIGIEDNKLDAIEAVEKAAKELMPGLNVVALETKYPQGAEKMLIEAVLKRTVPTGHLPFDVGVVVNNVGTAVAVYEAVAYKKPLIERVMTISGNGVTEPKNLLARIGTRFDELLGECGGIKKTEEELVILNGGPMMGISQTTLEVPAIKGTSGITVITAAEIKPHDYKNCIRCASCVDACPMGLMPLRIADMGRLGMIDGFKQWGAMNCIECGCCSFSCPAKRPLVQWIRIGKLKLRQSEMAKKK